MTDKFLRPAQAIGVLIALGGSAVIVFARQFGLEPSTVFDQRLMSTVAWWGLVILLFAWVATAEQQPVGSIGFPRLSPASIGWGFAAAVGLIVVLNGLEFFLPPSKVEGDPGGLLTLPLWMRLVLVLSSAVSEEVIFRGYPMTRLKELTGWTWLAVALPLAAFILLHFPSGGLLNVIETSIGGVVFTGLFLWRKDLWSNITAHFAVNLIALVVQPLLGSLRG